LLLLPESVTALLPLLLPLLLAAAAAAAAAVCLPLCCCCSVTMLSLPSRSQQWMWRDRLHRAAGFVTLQTSTRGTGGGGGVVKVCKQKVPRSKGLKVVGGCGMAGCVVRQALQHCRHAQQGGGREGDENFQQFNAVTST
jgi:hypothetical protein